MTYPWFHSTRKDADFYAEHLQGRLPEKILDAHVHMNLWEHVRGVPPERIKEDWALESGLHMDYAAAIHYYATLFPDTEVELNAFPFPLPEVDLSANNTYLGGLADQGKLYAMMSVRPEWDAARCEHDLLAHRFAGFKPYPYLAAREKGADISIFDFMPPHQLAVLDKHKKALTLHLPRHGRLPDPDNIRELRELRQRFPDIKVILAHLGRSFDPPFLTRGLAALGDDKDGFYYDLAAVTNADVLKQALETIATGRVLYGTDQPIFLWHGEQSWNAAGGAVNYAREDFSWNRHTTREKEEDYVFIAYLQMKNLLDALGSDADAKHHIFYQNARAVLRPY